MPTLSEKIDHYLLNLAWSLWTELGVAGIHRHHSQFLIAPEELILLTSVLAEIDPRLRDEALDWCSRHHHLISISRLRTLIKTLESSVSKSFSLFAATLNSISQAHWPVPIATPPLKCVPSGKSQTPEYELPALLCLRLRALFGIGARADLVTFFLLQKKDDFTASDTIEVGYTKRNLAEVLEAFTRAGILDVFNVRNQRWYRCVKHHQLNKIAGLIPKFMPPWRLILEVFLPLCDCIRRVESLSVATKTVGIRNLLKTLQDRLHRLGLTPPPLQSDFHLYWDSFAQWTIDSLIHSLQNKS